MREDEVLAVIDGETKKNSARTAHARATGTLMMIT